MILEVFPSGPLETNAYLIACEATRHAAVIDAPMECSDDVIRRAGELSVTIDKILLTHSHWDHIADVAILKEKLNVPVFIHRDDAGNLEHPGADRLPVFFPMTGLKPDGYLEEGQKIAVGNLSLTVIHTPGHTPGGVCFYLPGQHVLFSGDTLFHGTIGNLSLPTAQPALMWESLKKLAALPANTQVYPGHGGPTTIGEEKWIENAKKKFY